MFPLFAKSEYQIVILFFRWYIYFFSLKYSFELQKYTVFCSVPKTIQNVLYDILASRITWMTVIHKAKLTPRFRDVTLSKSESESKTGLNSYSIYGSHTEKNKELHVLKNGNTLPKQTLHQCLI